MVRWVGAGYSVATSNHMFERGPFQRRTEDHRLPKMAFVLREPSVCPCVRCFHHAGGQQRAHFSIQFSVIPLFNLANNLSTNDFSSTLRKILPTIFEKIRELVGLPQNFQVTCRVTLPRRFQSLKRTVSNVTIESVGERLATTIFADPSHKCYPYLSMCSSLVFLINVQQGLLPQLCKRFTLQTPGVHSFLDQVTYTQLRSTVTNSGLKNLIESPECKQVSTHQYMYTTATNWFLIFTE